MHVAGMSEAEALAQEEDEAAAASSAGDSGGPLRSRRVRINVEDENPMQRLRGGNVALRTAFEDKVAMLCFHPVVLISRALAGRVV